MIRAYFMVLGVKNMTKEQYNARIFGEAWPEEVTEELFYTKEINGRIYKKDENGDFIYKDVESGKTFVYDRYHHLEYYKQDGIPNKKYYLSGNLYEEGDEKGVCRRYAENGICIYEQRRKFFDFDCYELISDGKDRRISQRVRDGHMMEEYFYYSSGNLKKIKFFDGTVVEYGEDQTYKKYCDNRLVEETTLEGKTEYIYYDGTDQVEHIHKYDIEGKEIVSEYKHFSKKGNKDTESYLKMRRILAKKMEALDKKTDKQEDGEYNRKMSKVAESMAYIKDKLLSRKR